jgi:hypothetical protein
VTEIQWVIYAGGFGVALMMLYFISKGTFRTAHEVQAWQLRAERAENQVDTLLPALDRLSIATVELTAAVKATVHLERDRYDPGSPRRESP